MGDNCWDVTARERAAVADVVASTLRHDLRNKFASIRNASFFLMRRVRGTEAWEADPRVASFFQLIDQELAAAEAVLAGRGVPPVPEGRCRLGDAVARVLARVEPPEGVRVERELAEHTEVAADVEDVALLVRCLVDNAVEAMPAGGTLTVCTRDVPGGVLLRVEDSGEGMSAEARTRAFEPFFTTKPGHAGLGLGIVQRLALRHGAHVELVPGAGGGTRVDVVFFTGSDALGPSGAAGVTREET